MRVAALFLGLRDDARVKMALSGLRVPTDRMLLALMVDRLSLILWGKTKDGRAGRNRPRSIAEQLAQGPKTQPVQAYQTGRDFEAARNRIISEVRSNGR